MTLNEPIRSRSEMIAVGAKLRGMLGANPSVWTEGVATTCPWKTAVAVFHVL